MELLQTSELVRVEVLPECPSTNSYVREIVAAGASGGGEPVLVVTANQTAGRGRLGRAWSAPAGTALAASYYLPAWPASAVPASWAPLIVGVAVAEALSPFAQVQVKWPNDVLTARLPDAVAVARGGAKLCGVLCEALPDGGFVLGTGINVSGAQTQLPEGATSLALEAGSGVAMGALPAALADEILTGYVTVLHELLGLCATDPSALRQRVTARLATIGQSVRAQLPGGKMVQGFAVGLGEAGELLLRDARGSQTVVASADIQHLRLA